MSETPDERKALREAAEKATPGPWYARTDFKAGGSWLTAYRKIERGEKTGQTVNERLLFSPGMMLEEDAAFVARANPATILSLLDALETSEAKLVKAREALKPFSDTIHEIELDGTETVEHVAYVSIADLRRAAAVIKLL